MCGGEGHYRWENWPEQRPRLVEKVVGLEEVRKAVATQCETDWTSVPPKGGAQRRATGTPEELEWKVPMTRIVPAGVCGLWGTEWGDNSGLDYGMERGRPSQ